MRPVSLLGVATAMPERVVEKSFFDVPGRAGGAMFSAPARRRHVAPGESAADLVERAATKLVDRLGLIPARDIDLVLTNVSLPDQPFTGCGAEVAHRVGVRPGRVIDLHSGGCVSFIHMLDLARALIGAGLARGALLCNVQNAGGRVFGQDGNRHRPQAPVPGDGCGVAYVAAGGASPILSIAQRCHGEWASDMQAASDDGRRYWEPGDSPLYVGFTEARVAAIVSRGNRLVPEVVAEACAAAGVAPAEATLLVTNQPNRIFLRNWREALGVQAQRHHDTFDQYGNLFGAALPINLEDALAAGKLAEGGLLVLGGFAHAGDHAAAAVIRWSGPAAA